MRVGKLFIKGLSDNLMFGVRADKPGEVLRDYHTIKGGVRSDDGKIKQTQATGELKTVVSEHFYLCDASFPAVLQGPMEVIGRVVRAARIVPTHVGG